MKTGTLKQILLITDGCSNQGEDPAQVATIIAEQGITVNVIGILEDDDTEEPTGLLEVEEIASCGQGSVKLSISKSYLRRSRLSLSKR